MILFNRTRSTDSDGVTPGRAPYRERSITLAVVNVTNLMLVAAASSVTVALPDIQRHFDLSNATLSWVVTGYSLAFAALMLVAGKLGAIYGAKRTLMVGATIFVVASAMTGLAPGAALLVVARILQGVGAAVATPSTLVLLMANTDPGHRRTRAVSVFVLVKGAASAVGLVLGGVLTQAAGWEWTMYVNVPLGIFLIVVAAKFVRETPRKQVRLDYAGAVFSTLMMAALVIGFTDAAKYGWGSWQCIVPLVGAVVAVGLLVKVERRHEDPVVPLELFSSMRLAAPFLALLLTAAGFFAFFYFFSIFTQAVLHYDALKTGFAMLPFVVALIMSSQLVPRLMPIVGERGSAAVGAAIFALGLLWLGQLDAGSSFVSGLLGPDIAIGVGAGLALGPITTMAMHAAPLTHVSEASSLLQAAQQLGSAVGVAGLTSVYVHAGSGGDTARGIAAAMDGGAVFGVVALIIVALWGSRATPRRSTQEASGGSQRA